MKDRLITLVFAIAAFILSVFLLMPPDQGSKKPSLPTSKDRGSEGLMGLFKFLESNDIPVYSFRKRYTNLDDSKELTPTGNLLILSMPQPRRALKSEWLALHHWIDRGNTVLILGAVYYLPEWADATSCFCEVKSLLKSFDWKLSSERNSLNDESANDDFSFKQQIDSLQQQLKTFQPKKVLIQPQSKHVLLQAVTGIQSQIMTSLLEKHWTVKSTENLGIKLLALPEQENYTSMWQLEAGNGMIFLSILPDFFSNENLNKADNARFFSNMLMQSLSGQGKVIFDDYHFGLSDLYDSDQFFSDPRLHKTLGYIAILWLFYVVGYSNRLAPIQADVEKPSARDFVDAMAGFFSRHLDKKTVSQMLTLRLIQDIRQHRHWHDDQKVWQWLHEHPSLQTESIELLQKAIQKQDTSLYQTTRIITEIRKKIFL